MPAYRVAILTVSDRSSAGLREDRSGPAIAAALADDDAFEQPLHFILPDEQELIAARLLELADQVHLVLTTGGTGVAERDVTPEATRKVIARELPGFGELMRLRFFDDNARSITSRGLAGTRGRCLIVNLPGRPAGAVECLTALLPAIRHALDLLNPAPPADARTRRAHDEA